MAMGTDDARDTDFGALSIAATQLMVAGTVVGMLVVFTGKGCEKSEWMMLQQHMWD